MRWRQPADRSFVYATIQIFRGDAEASRAQLSALPLEAWRKSAYWLQASGLAFYFLDQILALDIQDAVPPEILKRFSTDLQKNRVRTDAMFREFKLLNQAFQRAGVVYANHKGFTLCPHACRSLELRHQMDFDFIVTREDLTRARHCLEARGYTLTAATPKTWEFKAGNYVRSRWDSYSMGRYRAAELHFGIGSDHTESDLRLRRRSAWCWAGAEYPALTPADQLIAQAAHLFKHLRSENTRPSWLLEFRRHVLSRRDDASFWKCIRELAATMPDAQLALGVSLLVTSQIMGRFAPADIEQWVVQSVPRNIHLWTEQYGAQSVLADFPGTKLFLLLEQELERLRDKPRVAVRKRLVPLRPAPPIFTARADERAAERLHRYALQVRFTLFRARFHIIEAARYLIELPRWRRLLAQHSLNARAVAKESRQTTSPKQLNDNLRPGSI